MDYKFKILLNLLAPKIQYISVVQLLTRYSPKDEKQWENIKT